MVGASSLQHSGVCGTTTVSQFLEINSYLFLPFEICACNVLRLQARQSFWRTQFAEINNAGSWYKQTATFSSSVVNFFKLSNVSSGDKVTRAAPNSKQLAKLCVFNTGINESNEMSAYCGTIIKPLKLAISNLLKPCADKASIIRCMVCVWRMTGGKDIRTFSFGKAANVFISKAGFIKT